MDQLLALVVVIPLVGAAGISALTPVFRAQRQALALTDVVVEAAVTALLLAIAVQAHKRFGTLDPQELVQLKG